MRRGAVESGSYALRGRTGAGNNSSNGSNNSYEQRHVRSSGAVPHTRHRRVKQELQDDQKKELKEAFELFDAEKNGSIDYHELKVSYSLDKRALHTCVPCDLMVRSCMAHRC